MALSRVLKSLYNFLKSFKLTVLLLSLIAILSALGSISNKVKILKDAGFTTIYYSPYFSFLLILFSVNLVLCTISIFKATKNVFSPKRATKTFKFKDPEEKKKQLLRLLRRKRLFIRKKGNLIAAYRYPFRRLVVYGIHLGVFVVAIGGIISSICGFEAAIEIPQGSANDIAITRSHRTLKLPFYIYNKEFSVVYYKNSPIPSQYQTVGYIVEGSKRIPFKVRVNHPIKYMGYWIYQASYRLDGSKTSLKLKIGDRVFKANLMYPLNYKNTVYTILNVARRGGKSYALLFVKKGNRKGMGWITEGSNVNVGNTQVKLINVHFSYDTILKVTKDPGSPIIIVGFVVLVISFVLLPLKFKRSVYKIESI